MPIQKPEESAITKSSVHPVAIKMKDKWEGQREKIFTDI